MHFPIVLAMLVVPTLVAADPDTDVDVSAAAAPAAPAPTAEARFKYLGEAYVQLGRLAEARDTLERLTLLDPKEADDLARAIAKAAGR